MSDIQNITIDCAGYSDTKNCEAVKESGDTGNSICQNPVSGENTCQCAADYNVPGSNSSRCLKLHLNCEDFG